MAASGISCELFAPLFQSPLLILLMPFCGVFSGYWEQMLRKKSLGWKEGWSWMSAGGWFVRVFRSTSQSPLLAFPPFSLVHSSLPRRSPNHQVLPTSRLYALASVLRLIPSSHQAVAFRPSRNASPLFPILPIPLSVHCYICASGRLSGAVEPGA